MIKEHISCVFMNFVEKPLVYVNLIQDLLKIIEEFAKGQIKEKIKEIVQVLNLKNFDEEKEKALYKQFLNVFQDYNNSVFQLKQENIEEILEIYKRKAEETVKFNYYSFEFNRKIEEKCDNSEENKNNEKIRENEKNEKIIENEKNEKIIENEKNEKIIENEKNEKIRENEKNEKIIENEKIEKITENEKIVEIPSEFFEFLSQLFETPELQKLISVYHSLCIYMSLNDPPLRTNLEDFSLRRFIYVLYKKNEFYCIDGFVKEKAPAIVVLPAVYRGNFIYNGIKPAVLILGRDFIGNEKMKGIIEELKEKEKENLAKKDENIMKKDENIMKKDENIMKKEENFVEISVKKTEEIVKISRISQEIDENKERKIEEIEEKKSEIHEITAIKEEISVEIVKNEEIPLRKEEEEIKEFPLFRKEKRNEENSLLKKSEKITRFTNKKAKTLNQFFP